MTKIIAIDGTAASGKGTLSRSLAAHMGFDFLDTGLLYRAVGYNMYMQKIKISDVKSILKMIREIDFSDLSDPNLLTVNSGSMASKVSVIPEVRKALIDAQRDFPNGRAGAVVDGRDIGTVIFPEADIKLYITADVEIRAKRRFNQLQNMGKSVIYEDVLGELRERDARDSGRKAAPLKPADDAVVVDTTNLNAASVLDLVISLTKSLATSGQDLGSLKSA